MTHKIAFCILLFLNALPSLMLAQQLHNPVVDAELVFGEMDGLAVVEAEYFYKQTEGTVRQWYRTSENEVASVGRDDDAPHWKDAGNQTYLEILPDTRVSHEDTLTAGENFSNTPGKMGILHYKVNIENPGRYYVWVRAYSTGSEDNGLHVGINGSWPESGQRLQWCEGKDSWHWESKQRTEAVHCGEPFLIYLDIEKSGIHDLTFSMREDGFEFDRFLLTRKKDYHPEGTGPEVNVHSGTLPEAYSSLNQKSK